VTIRRRFSRGEAPPDRHALIRERARLLTRLREIDRLLCPAGRETAVVTAPERR
jgi:hypothetical protein